MKEKVLHTLDKIKGLPLTKTTRNELVQYFHFGTAHYTTPQGLILDVGAYTLALNCPWQLKTADGDVIKHSEVYLRKREAGLPDPSFDWKEPGANLRDQRLKDLVKNASALAIEAIVPAEDYVLTLYFVNGSELQITPDLSKPEEIYWQLFSTTDQNFGIRASAEGLVVL